MDQGPHFKSHCSRDMAHLRITAEDEAKTTGRKGEDFGCVAF